VSGIRPIASAALLVPAFAAALCACTSTTDSLGYNGSRGVVLHTLTGPASYPNRLVDFLHKTPAEIDARTQTAVFSRRPSAPGASCAVASSDGEAG